MTTYIRTALSASALILAFLASPLAADDWYTHPFGELRANFSDWIAVCADDGAGPCRVVHSGRDDGSDAVFDYRLTLGYNDLTDHWVVEVMDRGMEHALNHVRLDFDGQWIDLAPGAWKAGETATANVAETFTILDPALSDHLIEMMKAGNVLTVTYRPISKDGTAQFSLRGVTAAIDAVEARYPRAAPVAPETAPPAPERAITGDQNTPTKPSY